MKLSNALDIINNIKPNEVEIFADLLPLPRMEEAYALTGIFTLRKIKIFIINGLVVLWYGYL